MMYFFKIASVTAIAFAIATPALAGGGAESSEFMIKQKACKKEASTKGLHLSKKTAYVKQCMAKT